MTARPETPSRSMLLGCPVDVLTMNETVERSLALMRSEGCHSQYSLNAGKVVEARRSPLMRDYLARATIVSADGMSVVWAGRVLGVPLRERVPGIDLLVGLLAGMEKFGLSPYFLGAREEIVTEAVARIAARHPQLRIAGFQHGHFPPEEDRRVAHAIRDAAPDALFVGMSSPRKEQWIDTYQPLTGARFAMGVGGSFDVLAGLTKRAPTAVQSLGLEWAYRIAQEPRRLAGRYVRTNGAFVRLVAHDLYRQRVASVIGRRRGKR